MTGIARSDENRWQDKQIFEWLHLPAGQTMGVGEVNKQKRGKDSFGLCMDWTAELRENRTPCLSKRFEQNGKRTGVLFLLTAQTMFREMWRTLCVAFTSSHCTMTDWLIRDQCYPFVICWVFWAWIFPATNSANTPCVTVGCF